MRNTEYNILIRYGVLVFKECLKQERLSKKLKLDRLSYYVEFENYLYLIDLDIHIFSKYTPRINL